MMKRTAARQECPICGTQQPIGAVRCEHCGASLVGLSREPTRISQATRPVAQPQRQAKTPLISAAEPTKAHLKESDLRHTAWDAGESDLHEGSLNSVPRSGLLVLVIALAVVIGGVWALTHQNTANPTGPAPSLPPQLVALASGTITGTFPPHTPSATIPPTNTRPPTITPAVAPPSLGLPTVTPQPPTPTITPTRGPCIQKARQGDTLSALAARCGQYSQDVIPAILDMNNMTSAAQLQIGQSVQIPWPTPTGGAGGAAVATGNGNGASTPLPPNVPTLPPGVAWYTVLKGDNAISIAYKFHATIKILHDLNPEIASDFSQCDYGLPAGGQTCSVRLSEGEQVRVPVPLPTPTRSPTPNGSETATPRASATFNAPYLVGPGDNMLFGPAEFPVLRWGASGELLPGQVYLITVQDVTANVTYHVTTTDTSYQLSYDWQPTDGLRHIYNWSVSVAAQGANGTPTPEAFVTDTRMFTWQGP